MAGSYYSLIFHYNIVLQQFFNDDLLIDLMTLIISTRHHING